MEAARQKNREPAAHPLGRWAVIDIETSGVDPLYDSIIDVGFLQFEGMRLINRFNSLVKFPQTVSHSGKLSYFVQKLTGITPQLLEGAPRWEEVEGEIQELLGHHLLAHNARFERSFLKKSFDDLNSANPEERERFEDSLPFLALLFPWFSSLNLERFITFFSIAKKERHRGIEDACDLLKVLIVAIKWVQQDSDFVRLLHTLFREHHLEEYWYYRFFCLSDSDLNEIARQLNFDWKKSLEMARDNLERQKEEVMGIPSSSSSLERPERTEFFLKFSGENIKAIFQDKKRVQKKIPFYKYRKTQEDLALRVGQSFKNKVHSLIQAPTGTGKTLGYLLPSSLFSLNEQKQVLVATGTKALQHQAMSKDVPQLRRLLGLNEKDFKVVQLLGSNNHLCELLFRRGLDEDRDLFFSSLTFEEKIIDIYFEVLFFHNSRIKSQDAVLRLDLPYVLKKNLKSFDKKVREIAVDFRSCTGSQCPFKMGCTYFRGLREAKEAHLIIGNHALMFNWPRSFPRPEYIIVDEAHKIEGEGTQAFSFAFDRHMLDNLLGNLSHRQGVGALFYLLSQTETEKGESSSLIAKINEELDPLQKSLTDLSKGFTDLVEDFFKKRPKYTELYWNEALMITSNTQSEATATAIYNRLESIFDIISDLSDLLFPYRAMWENRSFDEAHLVVAFTRFETFASFVDDIKEALECALKGRDNYINSVKYHEKQGFSFTSAPINIGQMLYDHLLKSSAATVFTSATLGNDTGDQGGKGAEWSTGHIYLENKRRFQKGLYLPAVYDYEKKAKVFLCDDTPSLYDQNFVEYALRPIMKLIHNLKGRSLLLFSAQTRFEIAREVLLKRFEAEIPLFIQGMGNSVVEDFKEVETGILLGMESFGEGIDIPGKALQFIFIDKIPDLRMDLVIQERRDFYEQNLGNEFVDYYLAHRTRSLHQKLGRLLRTEHDFGGVIIVDSRIKKWKRHTLGKVARLMGPYKLKRAPLQQACQEVNHFINGQIQVE